MIMRESDDGVGKHEEKQSSSEKKQAHKSISCYIYIENEHLSKDLSTVQAS